MSIFPADCVESCDCRSKIICEGARCDWSVAVVLKEGTLEEIFLVELKGSDIDHAFEQITGTMSILSTKCSAKKWFACVVCSSLPRLHVARHPLCYGTNFFQLYGKLEALPWA